MTKNENGALPEIATVMATFLRIAHELETAGVAEIVANPAGLPIGFRLLGGVGKGWEFKITEKGITKV